MEFIHEKIDIGYDDLIADTRETGRVYTTPDGIALPSITTVLSILSIDAIKAWRKRVGEEEANKISTRASGRGTLVHSIVEKYLKNEDTSKFLPHIRQSLNNLRPLLDGRISKIYGLEVPLYSLHLNTAGRCDCVGVYDGVPSIIDFKTSKRIKKKENISNYFAQMTAYAIMWEERTGMAIPNTVIIMDVDDNEPLLFKEHRDNYVDFLKDTIAEYNRRTVTKM